MLPKLEEFQRRRKLLGLTQNQLARRSGVSQSLIAKMERKTIDPSYGKVRKIEQTLEKEEEKSKTTARARDIHSYKIVKINKSDPILKASQIMRKHSFSQLPVYDDSKIVGSISESAINNYFSEGKDIEMLSKKQVGDLMEADFPKIDEDYPIEPITSLLKCSPAIMTTRKGKVVGIITRADLLKLIKR